MGKKRYNGGLQMIQFLRNDIKDISDVITAVSYEKKIPEVLIEKDLWVSYILDYLFNRIKYKDYFEFKGGTSLSKAYGLIERFSEDIDIVIKSDLFNVDINTIIGLSSKNQKAKAASELNEKALLFYENQLINLIKTDIKNELNKELNIYLNKEELAIYIEYPHAFGNDYVKPAVKVELGPLAAWTPNERRQMQSYIQQVYPNLFVDQSFAVFVTKPKRIFWKK